jgi:hypothetical protein
MQDSEVVRSSYVKTWESDLYINMFEPSTLLINILIKFSAVNIKNKFSVMYPVTLHNFLICAYNQS